jgi:hypothetical protein
MHNHSFMGRQNPIQEFLEITWTSAARKSVQYQTMRSESSRPCFHLAKLSIIQNLRQFLSGKQSWVRPLLSHELPLRWLDQLSHDSLEALHILIAKCLCILQARICHKSLNRALTHSP